MPLQNMKNILPTIQRCIFKNEVKVVKKVMQNMKANHKIKLEKLKMKGQNSVKEDKKTEQSFHK